MNAVTGKSVNAGSSVSQNSAGNPSAEVQKGVHLHAVHLSHEQEERSLRSNGFTPTEEAVVKLGRTRMTILRMVKKLGIIPHKDQKKFNWYSESDLHTLAKELTPLKKHKLLQEKKSYFTIHELENVEIVKDAFELFDQGKTPREAVKVLGAPPTVVRHLWLQWGTMGGGFFVTAQDARAITTYPWVNAGTIETWDDLSKALRSEFAMKKEEMRCRKCRQRPAKSCDTCVKQEIKKVEDAYLGVK